MQAESLEVLEKANVPPAQARAIVRAIEIEIGGAKDTLATKHDLVLLRRDIDVPVSALREEMREAVSVLRAEMREAISALREEMGRTRGELRGEIHAATSGVVRQMYMAVLGQMAVLLGFAYFFATHVR